MLLIHKSGLTTHSKISLGKGQPRKVFAGGKCGTQTINENAISNPVLLNTLPDAGKMGTSLK
jgi:hypothetical protein